MLSLKHHPLGVALAILHIEWMTQRHYLDSIQDNQELDPQFCSLLKHHWLEEAQHAKLDTKMLSLAQIEPGMKVLEPSAGLGHICREVKRLGVIPDCFEISPLLRRGLRLQGFNVLEDDFLNHTPTARYDRVLANPPFSRNGIARHTLRALDWLCPGGALVTVAHHYRLRPSRTDQEFFKWLQGFGDCFYDCGAAFETGDRPCKVPVQIIVVQKPRW